MTGVEQGRAPSRRVEQVPLSVAVAQARALTAGRSRVLLGLAGAPGAGKSFLADAIAAVLPRTARVVGMDGFHLAQAELERLGRAGRKGAVDTFDAAGYVALLRRLHDPGPDPVYAPVFDRRLEEPVGSSLSVSAEISLVVTEGNYLLVPDGPWAPVRGLLDVCWYLEPAEDLRLRRLVARHEEFGRSPQAAREWARGSDQRNAELVAATRSRADRVLAIAADPG